MTPFVVGQANLNDERTSARHPMHAVPDKSMKSMVLDMSDLHGTNVWLGEAELVRPGFGTECQEGLVEWMSKGCYATVLPLDGRDTMHMEWMTTIVKTVMRGLLSAGGRRRVGLTWKRCDGENSDMLGETSILSLINTEGDTSIGYKSLNRSRVNSARMRPRVVVGVENEHDVDVALRGVVDLSKGRIREDCVLSLVLVDEEECIFSMLSFVTAQSRLSFLNLVSLVEEIGKLHQTGKAGDFRLQCGQLTELNKLASMYLDGNTKLYVAAYPQQEDFAFVDSIASVCAGDQTVRTDIQWVDPTHVPEYETPSLNFNSSSKSISRLSDTEESLMGSLDIGRMKESLQARTSEHLSAAARSAMKGIFEEESPTNPKSDIKKSFPERRILHFHSGHSPSYQQQRQEGGWIDVDRSRDVFSSLQTNGHTAGVHTIENDETLESISLQRPTTSAEVEYDIPEFIESDGSLKDDHGMVNNQSWAHSKTSMKADVYRSIDSKVSEKLLESIGELQEQLEWSEMQRHQLEARVEALSNGLCAGWSHSDNREPLIKALSEERKSSRNVESLMLTMKQEKLTQEVEMATKDKQLLIANARIQALQNHSDVRIAYEMCEDELQIAQEEASYLREENAELARKLAMLEMSNLVQSHCPILPEDEDYDVNGAEGRIIYKLHEKIKGLQRKLSKAEVMNADMKRELEHAKREERRTIVTKKVAKDALAKLSQLTKKSQMICEP